MNSFTEVERQFSEFSAYLATGTCSPSGGSASLSSSSWSWWPLTDGGGPRPRPYLVTLRPGDALYVPPLWLHAVDSTSGFSASVNVFSPSAEARALEAALYRTPLPFEEAWAIRVTARAVVAYLGLVGQHLGVDLPGAARGLLASR